MKTNHPIRIFAIAVIAAMAIFSSCKKETLENNKRPVLAIEEQTSLSGNPGESLCFHFDVADPAAGGLSLRYNTEGPVSVKFTHISDKNGSIEIALAEDAMSDGKVILSITDSRGGCSRYCLNITISRFKVEFAPVVLEADRGSVAVITYTLDTNISEPELILTLEDGGTYFTLEGNTVTALRKNISGADRTTVVTISVQSGDTTFSSSAQIRQKSLPKPDNLVEFKDKVLQEVLVNRFDGNYDGEISYEEALLVEEIDIRGCGVTNLTGIGSFKNAWKLDARDNDIENGTEIARLPRLYWLDLSGNPNLDTIDISGCSMYFEHFMFDLYKEATSGDKIQTRTTFTATYNQIYSTSYPDYRTFEDDPEYDNKRRKNMIKWELDSRLRPITDDRRSTDFSRHYELVKIKEHTKGSGNLALVFSGMGFLDTDIKDGTYERAIRDLIYHTSRHYQFSYADNWECFDVYYLVYVSPARTNVEDYKQQWRDIASRSRQMIFGDDYAIGGVIGYTLSIDQLSGRPSTSKGQGVSFDFGLELRIHFPDYRQILFTNRPGLTLSNEGTIVYTGKYTSMAIESIIDFSEHDCLTLKGLLRTRYAWENGEVYQRLGLSNSALPDIALLEWDPSWGEVDYEWLLRP